MIQRLINYLRFHSQFKPGDRVAVKKWFDTGEETDDPGTFVSFTPFSGCPFFVHFDNGSKLSVHLVEPLVPSLHLAEQHEAHAQAMAKDASDLRRLANDGDISERIWARLLFRADFLDGEVEQAKLRAKARRGDG